MKKTTLLFLALIVIYGLLRICFWQMHFPSISIADVLSCFSWGFRSDFTFLFLLNMPVWCYLLLAPHHFRYKQMIHAVVFIYFFLANSFFLLLSYADLFYFSFIKRRTTIHLFSIIRDSLDVFDDYLYTYWQPAILFLILLSLFGYLSARTFFSQSLNVFYKKWWHKAAIGFTFLAAGILFSRGIERAPFQPVTLYLHVPAPLQPLASNTGFSILYSVLKPQTQLEARTYFSRSELDQHFSLERDYGSDSSFNKKNVIVFILESFSSELLDAASPNKAYTPFLDSITTQGVVCLNGYANAAESNKGIVAILGGIPSFFTEPYFHSVYATNRLNGIGSLLTKEGYVTSFFMGANKDHFGFQKWCSMIGIRNYYSMEDYNNPAHHDGVWGISDHYFLPYAAATIKKQKPPFFSAIFNLSSHLPFKIPDEMAQKFTIKGQTPQQNSISYVDFSIRSFFDVIKNETWYQNSIFVFAADHSFIIDRKSPPVSDALKIPMFIHIPGAVQTRIEKPVQQMDMVPTILDLLHYPRQFYSFGRSIRDKQPGYVYFGHDENYFILDSAFLLQYSGKREKTENFYHLKKDSLLQNNLAGRISFSSEQQRLERQMKLFLQRYTHAFLFDQISRP